MYASVGAAKANRPQARWFNQSCSARVLWMMRQQVAPGTRVKSWPCRVQTILLDDRLHKNISYILKPSFRSFSFVVLRFSNDKFIFTRNLKLLASVAFWNFIRDFLTNFNSLLSRLNTSCRAYQIRVVLLRRQLRFLVTMTLKEVGPVWWTIDNADSGFDDNPPCMVTSMTAYITVPKSTRGWKHLNTTGQVMNT